MLLERTFLWANLQKALADGELGRINGKNLEAHALPTSVLYSHLFAWYAFLYSLVEACLEPSEGRSIDLRGVFQQEIAAMQDTLRRCRNAVFHVPKSGKDYDDQRMRDLMSDPNTNGTRLRRVHEGFRRMLTEELDARK
jgi:hypothetical protein